MWSFNKKLYWIPAFAGMTWVCAGMTIFLAACGDNRAPVTHYGVEEGAGSTGAFSVLEGDTLWSVSKRFKISMQDIVVTNDLSEPYRLIVGQRLKLPSPREYQVRGGDTLYSVSRQFDTSTLELARLNDLSEPYVIHAREVLRLPSVSRSSSFEEEGITVESEQGETVGVASVQRESLDDPAQSSVSKPKGKPVSKAKRTKVTSRTPKRSSSKFAKPVPGKIISSYGPKKGGLHNDGINIKAPRGTAVAAAENGVVVYSGSELKGTGNLILVRHDDRWMSAYAHLDKRLIKRGDVIKRGQKIGTVGSTGSVDSPQLHFELRRGTKALNPKVYIEG